MIFICGILGASSIDISADSFEVDNKKLRSVFTGNVYIQKDNSNIKSDKLIISFTKTKKPKSYIASGDIVFNINMNNKKYHGLSDSLNYNVDKKLYVLAGHASLSEVGTNNKVTGNKITVDEKNSIYKIESDSNNRVKFIYNIDE